MSFTLVKGVDRIEYTTLPGVPHDREQPIRFKQGVDNTGIIIAIPKRLIERFTAMGWHVSPPSAVQAPTKGRLCWSSNPALIDPNTPSQKRTD